MKLYIKGRVEDLVTTLLKKRYAKRMDAKGVVKMYDVTFALLIIIKSSFTFQVPRPTLGISRPLLRVTVCEEEDIVVDSSPTKKQVTRCLKKKMKI